ncbi:MAG: DUF4339 domain-containing protein [Verrucomicrobia bacterium]|nr:DUF4339 domain-containing protein [Verrucomicrobiota bacterium]
MSDQWHLLQEGQQYGPYSGEQLQQFAQEGRIVRESMLWTEGLENWVSAAAVEGLFPPAPVAAPWAPPGARRPAGMAGGAATRGAMAGRGVPQAAYQVGGGPYPALETKPASFEMLAGLFGGGLALMVVAAWATRMIDKSAADRTQMMMLGALVVIGLACLVAGAILNYIYLGRLWSYLRHGLPRTTPGKAVGLLFVPLFNYYWIFVAIYGLAQDWNRIIGLFTDLSRAPKMSEGIFLTYCIGVIVFPPLALVLWFPVMSQVCRSINFLAYRPVHRAGTLQFG